MKRYILPIVLVVVGSFLFFFGGYQVRVYNDQPWTHFTGACVTDETSTGCPKEAAETDARLSSTLEGRVNQLWSIGILVGLCMILVGIVLGLYRFASAMRHKGIAATTTTKS